MQQFSFLIIQFLGRFPKSFWNVFALVAGLKIQWILGYRKKVVQQNLKNSFPQKTQKEINKITKNFYRHFVTIFTEIIRSASMAKFQAKNLVKVKNPEVVEDLWKKHNTIIMATGHIGNWDSGIIILPLFLTQKVYSLYKPLSNSHADNLMKKIRGRFGIKLLPSKEATRYLLANKKEKKIVAFIGDQSPFPENAYWMNFLNQPTPVFKGAEKVAAKLNAPVVFLSNYRDKQGKLNLSFKLITEAAAELPDGRLTHLHTKELEKQIQEIPEQWLWSHRRWKHNPTQETIVN